MANRFRLFHYRRVILRIFPKEFVGAGIPTFVQKELGQFKIFSVTCYPKQFCQSNLYNLMTGSTALFIGAEDRVYQIRIFNGDIQ